MGDCEYTLSVAEEAQIPELPVDVQGLIWELVKIEVRTRLKARLWKEVHDQIKRGFHRFFTFPNTLPISIPEGRFHVVMCEPIRTAFTEAGGAGIGNIMTRLRHLIDDSGNAPAMRNTQSEDSANLEDEETGIALQDVNLVAELANASVEDATASLTRNNGDIVDAIMELSG